METNEEKVFREYLHDQGLKVTPERQMILEEVYRIHEHFEADDVLIGLRGRGNRVSRASVYRTLPLLVEGGLLREVHSAEKHSHYEHIFGHAHHDHLICNQCGSTTEFAEHEIEEMQTRICLEHGFMPTSHKLEIIGICKDCSENRKRD